MALVRMSVPTMMVTLIASLSALKLRQKTKSDIQDLSLSPCLEKFATDLRKRLIDTSTKWTMQGTCHAYSGVNLPLEKGGSESLTAIQCRGWTGDWTAGMVTVEPGVRYMDLIPTLRRKHLYLTHGNYAGQTIIGLLSTGTHGSGWVNPHNFISELVVLNGLGELKRVTKESPDFPAWQNSMGVLGVVLTAKLGPLQPEFRIQTRNFLFHSAEDSLRSMARNVLQEGKIYSYMNCLPLVPGVINTTCINAERAETQAPLTKPFDKTDGTGCCADSFTPDFQAVVSSVDGDLYTAGEKEPEVASAYNCHEELGSKGIEKMTYYNGMIWEDGSFTGIENMTGRNWIDKNIRGVGYEIEVGEQDVEKVILLLPGFVKKVHEGEPAPGTERHLALHMRHVPQDPVPPLLSPYKYSPMFNVEFYLMFEHLQSEEDRTRFLTQYEWFCNSLRMMGANFRIHLGKGAVGNFATHMNPATKQVDGDNQPATPVWDMLTFNLFKMMNDPGNRFTNQKWEAFRTVYGLKFAS